MSQLGSFGLQQDEVVHDQLDELTVQSVRAVCEVPHRLVWLSEVELHFCHQYNVRMLAALKLLPHMSGSIRQLSVQKWSTYKYVNLREADISYIMDNLHRISLVNRGLTAIGCSILP